MLCLTLRFDGSYRGGCGGAGAVLFAGGDVLWQGARFISRCPTSAHAEYEGLLLGLLAAVQEQPAALQIEGDCRLVLTQLAGTARPRKLSRMHKLCTEQLSRLPRPPAFASIPRNVNAHADSLSRAAVEAASLLHGGAILGAARDGKHERAVATLERANQASVRLPPAVFDELLQQCSAAGDHRTVLSVYAATERNGKRPADTRTRAIEYAVAALEALGASSRGAIYAVYSYMRITPCSACSCTRIM